MQAFAIANERYEFRLHFGLLDQIRQAGYDLLGAPATTVETLANSKAVVTILHICCQPKCTPEEWAAKFDSLERIEAGTEVLLEALADFVGGRGAFLRAAAKQIRKLREVQETASQSAAEHVLSMAVDLVPGSTPGNSPEPSASAVSTASRNGS